MGSNGRPMANRETESTGIAGSVAKMCGASRVVCTRDREEHTGASEKIVGGADHLLKGRPLHPLSGDKHSIPSGRQGGLAESLPQSAFHFIPCYRIPNALSDQNSESIMVELIGKDPYHQILIGRAPAFPMDLVKPFIARKP